MRTNTYIHQRKGASVCGTCELQNFLASFGSALGCFFMTRTCTVLASSLALINLPPISGGQLSSAGKKKERKERKKRSLQPTEHYLCSAKWHWQSRCLCVAEHLAAKDPRVSLSLLGSPESRVALVCWPREKQNDSKRCALSPPDVKVQRLCVKKTKRKYSKIEWARQHLRGWRCVLKKVYRVLRCPVAKRGFNVLFLVHRLSYLRRCFKSLFSSPRRRWRRRRFEGALRGRGPLTDLFPSCQAGVKTSDD